MSAQALHPLPLSPEEYLAMESSSAVKHEYVAGYIYAMSGASDTHNIITGNLYMELRNHLRGTPCRTYMADMKARINPANCFYYPDILVSCEKPENPYYREQPILVIEVLSPSTAQQDRGEKWRDYQTLPSLKEYVLVSQDSMDARVFRRDEAGQWRQAVYTDGMVIPLASVGLEIPIEQVYDEAWG